MTFPSIRIEGAILSGDLLAKVERDDFPGQKPADFGLPGGTKVKDEIARAWAEAQSLWAIYRRRLDNLTGVDLGTSETRNLWIVPFLGLLGYQLERPDRAEVVVDKTYALSHRLPGRDGFPVHIVGPRHGDPAVPPDRSTLDVKAVAGPRMSPHALLQEYLNLTEHLYGLVTNGLSLRLLRDSSRLIKLSYVEFDLERIFTEQLFADFAVLFRLLHVSRLPASREHAAQCLLERYHQDTLESGARIRDGLRDAVEKAIVALANGFLAHRDNDALRTAVQGGSLAPKDYYAHLLRLIYRLLFLMVIEERGLVYPRSADRRLKSIYDQHYSLARLRRLAGHRFLADKNHSDLWLALRATFRLFEGDEHAAKLGLSPLAGRLFGAEALGPLNAAQLDNATLLGCLRELSLFEQPGHTQVIRVNYGAIATEEFGSVYESLLELHPTVTPGTPPHFAFKQAAGNERKTSGSYYTPSSLVECLLDSALDPVLEDRLKNFATLGYKTADEGVLALKVCDPACGSGHFLIAAAQRIARRLAVLRAGDEEPGPELLRHTLREVISHCIYGVDINPMSVELCKVGLWLEAMEAGKPLSFLDHHLRCGNSLLGATPELIAQGIPDDAFTAIEGDDKKACAALKKLNARERAGFGELFALKDRATFERLQMAAVAVESLPDDSVRAVEQKSAAFEQLQHHYDFQKATDLANLWCAAFVIRKRMADDSLPLLAGGGEGRGEKLAAAPLAQAGLFGETFQLPVGKAKASAKATTHTSGLAEATGITTGHLREFAKGGGLPDGLMQEVRLLTRQYRFFHWHLEFQDVFANRGFDVILGNPPWVRQELLKPVKQLLVVFQSFASTADSSVYFLERTAQITRPGGRVAMVTPNKWFRASYGEPLRKVLRECCRIQLLVDFGHSRNLFPDADTFPASITFEVTDAPVSDSEIAHFVRAHDSDRELHSLNELIHKHAVRVLHSNLRLDRWQLEGAAVSDLLSRLLATGQTLEAFLKRPLLTGIKTGFNEAFYVDSALRNKLVAEDPSAEVVFKRFLRGRDIKRWRPHWDDQWHIVIPSSQNRVWPWSAASNETDAESVFAKTFPAVHAHLRQFEASLRDRQDKGHYWWELRACDYYHDFEKPKFVVQCIAYYSQFALDSAGHYVNNKAIVIPAEDPFLLAILNSRVTWWIVNRTFQHMKDEGVSVDVQFLKRLPVPTVGEPLRASIESLAAEIIAASESPTGSDRIPSLELRLNELVTRAFNLTDAEQEVLISSLPPRDPIAEIESNGPSIEELMTLPSEPRTPFDHPYQYVVSVMVELLLRAGGSLSWNVMRMATDLLADRARLARLAKAEFGPIADQWLALDGDVFDLTERWDQLSGFCFAGRLRVVRRGEELVVELLSVEGHLFFPHVRFDARLALAVARSMPDTPAAASAVAEIQKLATLVGA